QPDLVGARLQRRLRPPLRKLLDPLEQRLDASEILDELRGRLVADARNPGDVVRAVAAQGLEVDELQRLETVALADLVRPVDERVGDAAPRDQRLDRIRDEL